MKFRHATAVVVLAFSTALIAGACGEPMDERAALEQDELARELDLALQGDTAPATFQDTALVDEPEPPPAAAVSTPPPAPPARPTPTPTPAPAPVVTRPATPAPPAPVVRVVPSGTAMAVRLDQTLSTDANNVGDSFTATVADPVIAGDGTVLIPSGATVRGRVTAVSESGHVGETAVIKLAFEAVSFGGKSFPLEATVIEANPERRNRRSTGEQAARVAAGAAAGAILGQIFGRNTESTVKGAVIGAAAGTAIALGTSDVDAVIPSGSRMVIRLDTPVQMDLAT